MGGRGGVAGGRRCRRPGSVRGDWRLRRPRVFSGRPATASRIPPPCCGFPTLPPLSREAPESGGRWEKVTPRRGCGERDGGLNGRGQPRGRRGFGSEQPGFGSEPCCARFRQDLQRDVQATQAPGRKEGAWARTSDNAVFCDSVQRDPGVQEMRPRPRARTGFVRLASAAPGSPRMGE